jgi:hypothetical protein
MTGDPGIPPGRVMVRCWTGWATREDAVKRMPPAAVRNNGVKLDNKPLARFITWQLSRRRFSAEAMAHIEPFNVYSKN